jgi:hypothetical protein
MYASLRYWFGVGASIVAFGLITPAYADDPPGKCLLVSDGIEREIRIDPAILEAFCRGFGVALSELLGSETRTETIVAGQIGLRSQEGVPEGITACSCPGVRLRACSSAKGGNTCEAFSGAVPSDTAEQLLRIKTGSSSCETMCQSSFGGSVQQLNDCLQFCSPS